MLGGNPIRWACIGVFNSPLLVKQEDHISMCLLAVLYRLVPESPILVAANREEYYDRASQPPSIQSGKPRVLCGMDQRAGGTWLGVNQHGMFVGLCNRRLGNGDRSAHAVAA